LKLVFFFILSHIDKFAINKIHKCVVIVKNEFGLFDKCLDTVHHVIIVALALVGFDFCEEGFKQVPVA
jgi:hypothetical protein